MYNWNNFDNLEIKSIHAKTDLNNKLKEYLLSRLKANVTCDRFISRYSLT
jgi:hypothetical protein